MLLSDFFSSMNSISSSCLRSFVLPLIIANIPWRVRPGSSAKMERIVKLLSSILKWFFRLVRHFITP